MNPDLRSLDIWQLESYRHMPRADGWSATSPPRAISQNTSAHDDDIMNGVKIGVPSGSFKKFDANFFEILGRDNYPAVEPYENSF